MTEVTGVPGNPYNDVNDKNVAARMRWTQTGGSVYKKLCSIQAFRFHVKRLNKTRIGNISSLPASISMQKMIFEKML